MQFEESEPWLRFPFADCLVFSNVSDLKSKCDEMFFFKCESHKAFVVTTTDTIRFHYRGKKNLCSCGSESKEIVVGRLYTPGADSSVRLGLSLKTSCEGAH